ncbi:hypothetical protein FO519_008884 [Halicephalobus sp. NKZ332]|nr:hypothetical protein FO519_008884 [Halicephalobus sp. NKZ332]
MKTDKSVVVIEPLELSPEERAVGEKPDQSLKAPVTILALIQFIFSIDVTIDSFVFTFLGNGMLVDDEIRFFAFVYNFLILSFQMGDRVDVSRLGNMDTLHPPVTIRITHKPAILPLVPFLVVSISHPVDVHSVDVTDPLPQQLLRYIPVYFHSIHSSNYGNLRVEML